MVHGEQVAGEAQVPGHGLGQGLLGALHAQAVGQALHPRAGQVARELGVAAGIVMDRAGDGGLQQRKLVLGRPPGFAQ
jgi:hypothetical protein